MSNIASLLRGEIVRLSRKEVRSETEQLRKSAGRYRAEIASLKKRVTDLERTIKKMTKSPAQSAQTAATSASRQVRFSASGLKKLRDKHGQSAAVMGTILGVTPQTIYSWEAGNTRPGIKHIEKIAALRQIGKRQFAETLQAMSGQ
jgi:DNA-binding XRE family transcriptional regulator